MDYQPKPVTDLSAKVVSVARAIDRLPPGEYNVKVIKPESKTESWVISIDKTETVQTMTLPAKIVMGNDGALRSPVGSKI